MLIEVFMGKINNSKDLLMVLLTAKGNKKQKWEPIIGRTRLMKMIFLFEKEIRKKFDKEIISEKDLPKFDPYDYGPFSAKVYEDLEFLINMGFIDVTSSGKDKMLPDEMEEYEYWQTISHDEEDRVFVEQFSLSELGKRYVQKKIELSTHQWSILAEFKNRCTVASLSSLLKYIYSRYPKYITKSKIRDQVLR